METDTQPSDEKLLAEYLGLLFQDRPTWTASELRAEGVFRPALVLRQRRVTAHLGQQGIFVNILNRGKVFKAVVLEPVEGDGLPPVSANTEDFVFPEWAPLVKRAIQLQESVLVVGPAGCGKTTALRLLLRDTLPEGQIFTMSLHGEMSTDDFYGTRELDSGNTVFRPGPTLRAMQIRRPLLINELDAAPPEILFCLHQVLEKGPVTLTAVNDESDDSRP